MILEQVLGRFLLLVLHFSRQYLQEERSKNIILNRIVIVGHSGSHATGIEIENFKLCLLQMDRKYFHKNVDFYKNMAFH